METKQNTKMIGGNEAEVKNKAVEKEEEFFFSGGGEHLPLTVKAVNQAEALKVYDKTKIKVNK